MARPLSMDKVKRDCRPGQGADTCICLVAGPHGFECVYGQMEVMNLQHESLWERYKRGVTVAKRYGCADMMKGGA